MVPIWRIDPNAGATSNEVLCRVRVGQNRIPVSQQTQLNRVRPRCLQADNVARHPRLRTARRQGIIKPVLSQIEAVVIGSKYKGHIESVDCRLYPGSHPVPWSHIADLCLGILVLVERVAPPIGVTGGFVTAGSRLICDY